MIIQQHKSSEFQESSIRTVTSEDYTNEFNSNLSKILDLCLEFNRQFQDTNSNIDNLKNFQKTFPLSEFYEVIQDYIKNSQVKSFDEELPKTFYSILTFINKNVSNLSTIYWLIQDGNNMIKLLNILLMLIEIHFDDFVNELCIIIIVKLIPQFEENWETIFELLISKYEELMDRLLKTYDDDKYVLMNNQIIFYHKFILKVIQAMISNKINYLDHENNKNFENDESGSCIKYTFKNEQNAYYLKICHTYVNKWIEFLYENSQKTNKKIHKLSFKLFSEEILKNLFVFEIPIYGYAIQKLTSTIITTLQNDHSINTSYRGFLMDIALSIFNTFYKVHLNALRRLNDLLGIMNKSHALNTSLDKFHCYLCSTQLDEDNGRSDHHGGDDGKVELCLECLNLLRLLEDIKKHNLNNNNLPKNKGTKTSHWPKRMPNLDFISNENHDIYKKIINERIIIEYILDNLNIPSAISAKIYLIGYLMDIIECSNDKGDNDHNHNINKTIDYKLIEKIEYFIMAKKYKGNNENYEILLNTLKDVYIMINLLKYQDLIQKIYGIYIEYINHNSATIRLKALNIYDIILKINPEYFNSNHIIQNILKLRLYDNAIIVRTYCVQLIQVYIKSKNNYKTVYLEYLVDRIDDISNTLRKDILSFFMHNIQNIISSLIKNDILIELIIKIISKIYDIDDIRDYAYKILTKIVFKSYRPCINSSKNICSAKKKSSVKKYTFKYVDQEIVDLFNLLKHIFTKLGNHEWLGKILQEVDNIGTIDPEEIIFIVKYCFKKLEEDANNDNTNFYFWILYSLSKNYSSEFLKHIDLFYDYLYNYNKDSKKNRKEFDKISILKICEIIHDIIITNQNSIINTTISNKFKLIENELKILIFNEDQLILSQALKTLCISSKFITNNIIISIKDMFLKCYIFLQKFLLNLKNQHNENDNMMNDQIKMQEIQLPYAIRCSYIVSNIIKYVNLIDFIPRNEDKFQLDEKEIIVELFRNFKEMIHYDKLIELKRTGIDCSLNLWEKNPMLVFESKDFIIDLLVKDNNMTLKLQIVKIFYNMLIQYVDQKEQKNLSLFKNIQVNFFNSNKKGYSITELNTPKKKLPLMNTNSDMDNIIHFISDCIKYLLHYLFSNNLDLRIIILRIIKILIENGEAHTHEYLPKVFALMSDYNKEIRSLSLDIVLLAFQAKKFIFLLELENCLDQIFIYMDQYKKDMDLYMEIDDKIKISYFDAIYKEIRDDYKKNQSTRSLFDAWTTMLLTNAKKPHMISFLCFFMLSLNEVSIIDFYKILNSLKTFIEKNYQRNIQLLRSFAKSNDFNTQEYQNYVDKEIYNILPCLITLLTFNLLINKASINTLIKPLIFDDLVDGMNTQMKFIDYFELKYLKRIDDCDIKIYLNTNSTDQEIISKILQDFMEAIHNNVHDDGHHQNIYMLYKLLKKLYKCDIHDLNFLDDHELLFRVKPRNKKIINKKKMVMTKITQTAQKNKNKVKKVRVIDHVSLTTVKAKKMNVKDDGYDYDEIDKRQKYHNLGHESTRKSECNEFKLKLRKRKYYENEEFITINQ